jgi:hypothetical protein
MNGSTDFTEVNVSNAEHTVKISLSASSSSSESNITVTPSLESY